MLTVGNLRGREHALEKRLATATDSGFNAMHFGDVQTQSDDHESLGRSNGARVNASWLAPAPRASRSRGPAHSFAACQAAYSAREAEIAAPQAGLYLLVSALGVGLLGWPVSHPWGVPSHTGGWSPREKWRPMG